MKNAGCDDFVRKPIQEAEILDKMAEHLGVRYRYADGAVEKEGEMDDGAIGCEDLDGLPEDWLVRVCHAAKRGESEEVLDLIGQLPPDRDHLASALENMINEYQFSRIVALTEKGNSHD